METKLTSCQSKISSPEYLSLDATCFEPSVVFNCEHTWVVLVEELTRFSVRLRFLTWNRGALGYFWNNCNLVSYFYFVSFNSKASKFNYIENIFRHGTCNFFYKLSNFAEMGTYNFRVNSRNRSSLFYFHSYIFWPSYHVFLLVVHCCSLPVKHG